MPKRYTKRSETLGEMHPTLKSIRHYSDPFNHTDKTYAVDHCTLRHICPIFPFTHPTTQPTMNPPTIPPMNQNVTQYPSTQSTTPRPVTTHPSTKSATAHQLPQNTEAKKGTTFNSEYWSHGMSFNCLTVCNSQYKSHSGSLHDSFF